MFYVGVVEVTNLKLKKKQVASKIGTIDLVTKRAVQAEIVNDFCKKRKIECCPRPNTRTFVSGLINRLLTSVTPEKQVFYVTEASLLCAYREFAPLEDTRDFIKHFTAETDCPCMHFGKKSHRPNLWTLDPSRMLNKARDYYDKAVTLPGSIYFE